MFGYQPFDNTGIHIYLTFYNLSEIFLLLGPAVTQHPAYGPFNYNVYRGGQFGQNLYSSYCKYFDKYSLGL